MEMAKKILVALALLESSSSSDEEIEELVLTHLMMENSDDEIRNNTSTTRKGARYSPYKRNAFMTAVRQGRVSRVKEIINSREPCYAEEWKDGYSLLRAALEKKHTQVAKLLLTSGSKVNSRYKSPSNTALHFAALNGDTEIVQMLLDRGANVDAKNVHSKTPLHNAVQSMEAKMISLLLNRGANVDAADKSGVTPLHIAVGKNNKELTTLLLSRGANVEGKGNNARTSRRIAADTENGSTPLHLAVMRGNIEITELLLSKGADVNASGHDDITPLHIATRGGYLEIVEHLLKYGANVYSASENGQTPLYFAVGNGHKKIVKLLLERGAYVDGKDKNDKTILHLAVQYGSPIIVKRILKQCPNLNDKSNSSVLNAAVQGYGVGRREIVKNLLEYGFTVNPEDGFSFMHPAIEKGYVELVEELLEHGADVTMLPDSTLGKDSIPLHVATRNGHEEVAELLINYGADVNAQDETGKPAIFYATQNADLKMIKLLLTNKANVKDHPELLKIAVNKGCVEIVEILLQHGADINATDKFGKMPIQLTDSDEEQIRFGAPVSNPDAKGGMVFDRGAKAKNTRDKNCTTVLQAAIDGGFAKVVETLLKYNADVNSTRKGEMTTLHLSAKRGNKVITKMLLEKGADVNAEDSNGMTPLHFATQSGYGEVVELLLKRGADVNATTKDDLITPLHLAAESNKYGSVKIVKPLLKFGAKVDSKLSVKCHAFTPLHRAAITGIVEVVELLLEFGACVDAVDIYGTTALHFASKIGHEEVVTALLEHGADITMKSKGCYTALRFVTDGIDLIRDNNYGLDYDFNFDFDYDYDYETSTYINIAEILKSHMVKMRAANLYAANDELLPISSGDDEPNDSEDYYPDVIYYSSVLVYRRERKGYRLSRSNLRSKCEKEIASMKSEKFANTYITVYDILTKDVSRLAMYARNESIVEAFRSGDYKKKFPIYGNMISINFRKGKKRKEFLEQGNKILDALFNNLPDLPRGCTERIISYLNDDDLRTLMEAGKPSKCSNRRGES
ncbi:uncharacterized protein LOC143377154 [Andrena cerasifolii]|uniref:uncharacterized protein LOC143377154 n=1 Tax=Andrena cerasifolii TaxID=2819439 RepID=UPI00403796EB